MTSDSVTGAVTQEAQGHSASLHCVEEQNLLHLGTERPYILLRQVHTVKLHRWFLKYFTVSTGNILKTNGVTYVYLSKQKTSR